MADVIELDTFRDERYGNAFASQIHVFDIDISLTTIVYQRHPGTLNFLGRRRPSFLEDYAIEGRVEEARHPENGSSLLVYLSGYDDPLSRRTSVQRRPAFALLHSDGPARRPFVELADVRPERSLPAPRRIACDEED